MGRGKGKAVLVKIPKEIYEQIEELVQKGLYRAPTDFFYVGQKELDRAIERLRQIQTCKYCPYFIRADGGLP
ncbi:hypothetical protein DRP04_01985 [Archaeoglobales archaeon]|nr:MAG: hypothetical protein DRP04_01985 [Archaeoglobales archaeon]